MKTNWRNFAIVGSLAMFFGSLIALASLAMFGLAWGSVVGLIAGALYGVWFGKVTYPIWPIFSVRA